MRRITIQIGHHVWIHNHISEAKIKSWSMEKANTGHHQSLQWPEMTNTEILLNFSVSDEPFFILKAVNQQGCQSHIPFYMDPTSFASTLIQNPIKKTKKKTKNLLNANENYLPLFSNNTFKNQITTINQISSGILQRASRSSLTRKNTRGVFWDL